MLPSSQLLARRLLAALLSTISHLGAELRRETAPLQLTGAQFAMLRALSKADVSVGFLAKQFRVAMPTVTEIADNLTKKGLAERHSDPLDRRLVWLRITDQGKQAFNQCQKEVANHLAETLSRMNPQQRQTLVESLEAFVEAVEESQVDEESQKDDPR
ncbi:MAG: MarR family transcriptional regulator [Chloroflexi bacterium]|nr:MarR family transcriptional regulator [Chloroflexota bacterium]